MSSLAVNVQSHRVQVAQTKGAKSGRRRISQIHNGDRDRIDQEIEALRDTEYVSEEHEVRRPDAQDLFAWKTRRLLRQAEGLLRSLNERMASIESELRGGGRKPVRRDVA